MSWAKTICIWTWCCKYWKRCCSCCYCLSVLWANCYWGYAFDNLNAKNIWECITVWKCAEYLEIVWLNLSYIKNDIKSCFTCTKTWAKKIGSSRPILLNLTRCNIIENCIGTKIYLSRNEVCQIKCILVWGT